MRQLRWVSFSLDQSVSNNQDQDKHHSKFDLNGVHPLKSNFIKTAQLWQMKRLTQIKHQNKQLLSETFLSITSSWLSFKPRPDHVYWWLEKWSLKSRFIGDSCWVAGHLFLYKNGFIWRTNISGVVSDRQREIKALKGYAWEKGWVKFVTNPENKFI